MKEKHLLAMKACQCSPNNWALRRKSEPEIQYLIKAQQRKCYTNIL